MEEIIKTSVEQNVPLMIIGETGIGKTTTLQAYSDKVGKVLHRISINGSIGTEEILGKFLLRSGSTEWVDGPLIAAMKSGDWIVFDELNAAAPEILFSLHGILDHEKRVTLQEKSGEVIQAHPDFRFFATMNPPSYAGTRNLNAAFLSRFIVTEMTVLPLDLEVKLIMEKSSLTDKSAAALVDLATKLRNLKLDREINYFCSTRDLIITANLSKGVSKNIAFTCGILNKMHPSDLETVIQKYPNFTKLIEHPHTGEDILQAIEKFERSKVKIEKAQKDKDALELQVKMLKDQSQFYQSEIEQKVVELKKVMTEAEQVNASNRALIQKELESKLKETV